MVMVMMNKVTKADRGTSHYLFLWQDCDHITEDEIGVACSAHGELRNASKILAIKSEMKQPLARPWRG